MCNIFHTIIPQMQCLHQLFQVQLYYTVLAECSLTVQIVWSSSVVALCLLPTRNTKLHVQPYLHHIQRVLYFQTRISNSQQRCLIFQLAEAHTQEVTVFLNVYFLQLDSLFGFQNASQKLAYIMNLLSLQLCNLAPSHSNAKN